MLIILNEGKYEEYRNARERPSEYCKGKLGYKAVKKYDFIQQYFSDIDVLIHALHEYRRVSRVQRNEKTLWDLLKTSER